MKTFTLMLATGPEQISIHPMVWDGFEEIARRESATPSEVVQQLVNDRRPDDLAAAIVAEVVAYFRVLVARLELEAEQRRRVRRN
ncbi:hypothetical protein [Inquilinus sp. CAU 1745]|uniref:hypothetical protein n=1 Tax=Inquilinus sp. CAU 1745 TaxID=3140369 RepID=UPI00325BBA05